MHDSHELLNALTKKASYPRMVFYKKEYSLIEGMLERLGLLFIVNCFLHLLKLGFMLDIYY